MLVCRFITQARQYIQQTGINVCTLWEFITTFVISLAAFGNMFSFTVLSLVQIMFSFVDFL